MGAQEEILKELKNINGCITKFDKKLSLFIQKTEIELNNIAQLDDRQNKALEEHIEGVRTLKKLFDTQKKETDRRIELLEEETGKRLELLEEPIKAKKLLRKYVASIGIWATAFTAVGTLSYWIFKWSGAIE